MSTQVEMETLPKCDFCPSTAQYDTKTKVGSWAYTCATCYDTWGIRTLIDGRYKVGKLGTGYGQKLVTTYDKFGSGAGKGQVMWE